MKALLRKVVVGFVVITCFVAIQDMDYNDPYLKSNNLLVSANK